MTRNPWNTDHVPAVLPGGSAAAVAAGECYFALGSDTGGSIRQPAYFLRCGGIEAHIRNHSRYGLVVHMPRHWTRFGIADKNVADCAGCLEVIASHDVKDATSDQ